MVVPSQNMNVLDLNVKRASSFSNPEDDNLIVKKIN